MWTRKRRASTAESRALLGRLKGRGWRGEGERDDLLRQAAAATDLEPDDVSWMIGESDAALRQTGLAILRRAPVEAASESLHPLFGNRNEAVRRHALEAMEALWGPAFPERVQTLLSHQDPAIVHAALDWLRQHPSERALGWVAPALASGSPAVRRKAFAIVEATPSPKSAAVALRALETGDEEMRFRAIGLLVRFPDESHIASPWPLPSRSPRLGFRDRRAHSRCSPTRCAVELAYPALLTGGNPNVRQLAVRILVTQEAEVAVLPEPFCNARPARDRSVGLGRSLAITRLSGPRDDPDPHRRAGLSLPSPAIPRKRSCRLHRVSVGKDWLLRDRAARPAETRRTRPPARSNAVGPRVRLPRPPLSASGDPKAAAAC